MDRRSACVEFLYQFRQEGPFPISSLASPYPRGWSENPCTLAYPIELALILDGVVGHLQDF